MVTLLSTRANEPNLNNRNGEDRLRCVLLITLSPNMVKTAGKHDSNQQTQITKKEEGILAHNQKLKEN